MIPPPVFDNYIIPNIGGGIYFFSGLPSSSPVGPEVNDIKRLRGSGIVPKLIYDCTGLPSHIERIIKDNMLIPATRAKENNNNTGLILPEKHLLTKADLVSSGRNFFQPTRSKYVGDHAQRLRTIHIITGGAWKIRLAEPATKIISAQIST
jgi:hypothetical protein